MSAADKLKVAENVSLMMQPLSKANQANQAKLAS
ncbi:hypothetical protein BAR24066_00964 [Burkholderia arboris]|uniref:Uncharacterized protein n=1 Tax=Burkholderia arboris TaxID=488730 RepID=A0A9Q9SE85_9BURK|nr:hypothetical protein BAR24066_00964 [Burkholderia arboris]